MNKHPLKYSRYQHWHKRAWLGLLAGFAVGTTMIPGVGLSGITSAWADPTAPANPTAASEYTYTAVNQKEMQAVWANSVEETGEGTNGPLAKALDGDTSTYWHTQWQGTVIKPPHSFVIKLADKPIDHLGRIELTPRQSSHGSGRAADVKVFTLSGKECTEANKDAAEWQEVASASIPAHFDENTGYSKNEDLQPVPLDFTKEVSTNCIKVTYLSTWGGGKTKDSDGHEQVGSLAEFNAYTRTPKQPLDKVVAPTIADVLTLTDGTLTVKADPAFPRPLSYELAGKKLLGNVRTDNELPTFVINGSSNSPQVTIKKGRLLSPDKAIWEASTSAGQSFTVEMTVAKGALDWRITKIKDDSAAINTIAVKNLDLVTLDATDPTAQISSTKLSVDRNISGDTFTKVSTGKGERTSRWLVANNQDLAAAFASNAITTDTKDPNHFLESYQTLAKTNSKIGTVGTVGWFYRHSVSASKSGERDKRIYPAAGTGIPQDGIGPDPDPFVKVAVTADANGDGTINWQDGAIAYRSIMTPIVGGDRTKNLVIPYIPFNIVSQATNPFLKTLDDIKRISLATDNLGQRALLKGYQAEGHDSAQGDYGGHYNQRAGGFTDLVKLANGARPYNTILGVHVNVTESYSEAYAFNEHLLKMPPELGWGWMNQAYYMNNMVDMGSGNVVARFAKFKQDLENAKIKDVLNWLYFDVYYPYGGWLPQRLAGEMSKQGWVISSEWAYALSDGNTWSHWTNEERYGGSKMKGINSQIVRFMENHLRDTWNPDPLLDYSQMVDFTGWSGHVDFNSTYSNIWKRNLPVKFLQQAPIVKWEPGMIQLANGTKVTGPKELQGAPLDTRTGRTITFDGATVYNPAGDYLLPWTDGGSPRLYHYNPQGGTKTYQLTKSWQGYANLHLYELTDQGRKDLGIVPVANGSVTLPASIAAGKAYVLYPGEKAPAPTNVTWGEGTYFADPGFNSGDISKYQTTGAVKVVKNARANYVAQLDGPGIASLAQKMTLPAGTYSAWAWVQVAPQQTRIVDVSVMGASVKAAKYQTVKDGVPTSTISASTAINATASDPLRWTESLPSTMQRVPVIFTTAGGEVTFKVTAAAGTAPVQLDNLRVVSTKEAIDPSPTPQTVYFTDFENVDTGYGPFVTGKTNKDGDARTQLAERHEPFSQRGWYGKQGGAVVKGGKLLDNVLAGNWSLMAHEENNGEILRTHAGSVSFKSGHKYRVSMDYQVAYDDTYDLGVNYDKIRNDKMTTVEVNRKAFAATGSKGTQKQQIEFTTGCGEYFINVIAKGNPEEAQRDLVIDNFRVEDLGVDETPATCSAVSLQPSVTTVEEGNTFELKGLLNNNEPGEITNIKYEITGPDGFKYTVKQAGPEKLARDADGEIVWTSTMPTGVKNATFTLKVTYTSAGKEHTLTTSTTVTGIGGVTKGVNHLSALNFEEIENGWGPVERDRENGEQGSGDGGIMKMGDKEYPRGLGAHATSKVKFTLDGKCQRLRGVVGQDDTQPNGDFTVSVLGDSDKALFGPVRIFRDHKQELIDVDITDTKTLTLYADAGASNGNDHVDWGDIRVICEKGNEPLQPALKLTPEKAVPGAKVQVTLTDLQPLEPVQVTVPGLQPNEVLTVVADTFGKATVSFVAPNKPGETIEVVAKQQVAKVDFIAKAPLLIIGEKPTPTPVDPTPTPTPPTPVDPIPTPKPPVPVNPIPTPALPVPAKPAPAQPKLSHTGVEADGAITALGLLFIGGSIIALHRRKK